MLRTCVSIGSRIASSRDLPHALHRGRLAEPFLEQLGDAAGFVLERAAPIFVAGAFDLLGVPENHRAAVAVDADLAGIVVADGEEVGRPRLALGAERLVGHVRILASQVAERIKPVAGPEAPVADVQIELAKPGRQFEAQRSLGLGDLLRGGRRRQWRRVAAGRAIADGHRIDHAEALHDVGELAHEPLQRRRAATHLAAPIWPRSDPRSTACE